MSRWVRIQTSIFDHEAFAAEPFSEREAWMWLISKAAWKDTKHRIGYNVVDVPTGSMFLTLREMQATWRWKSDKRVRSFLSMLEREEMITTKTDAGKTQVSICNYARFQDSGRTEDAAGTHIGRTSDALKTPVNQDNYTADARDPLAGRDGDMLDALGITDETKSPGLLSLSEPYRWIAGGCDIDLDIIPALRSIAARGRSVRSWAYCSDAVFEARDKRLAPPPPVRARSPTAPPRSDIDRMNAALDSLISGDSHEPEHHNTIDTSFERGDRRSPEGFVQRIAIPARH